MTVPLKGIGEKRRFLYKTVFIW